MPPRLGRTAQENEFADWLIETISASLNQRTMPKKEMISRGTRQFGLSERRAKALREEVIDHLNAEAWLSAGAPQRQASAHSLILCDLKIVQTILAEKIRQSSPSMT